MTSTLNAALEESVPFLNEKNHPDEIELVAKSRSARQKWSRVMQWSAHWTAHLLLGFLLFLLFEERYLVRHSPDPFIRQAEKVYNDIHSIVQFDLKNMEPRNSLGTGKDESWIGPPDRVNVQQWWDLTHVGVISISDEEQSILDMETSRANDTGEYFVVPQVYHDLHCLKKMREAFWGINLNNNLDAKGRKHMDHCIDLIRRNLMCNADLSPYPFHWGGDKHRADYNIQRQCRKWEVIHDWAKRRNTTGYVL